MDNGDEGTQGCYYCEPVIAGMTNQLIAVRLYTCAGQSSLSRLDSLAVSSSRLGLLVDFGGD